MHRLSVFYILARIRPSDRRRRKTESLLVRIIADTISDAALPGYGGEPHRLLTTLLGPVLAPALDLAGAYHERWEIGTGQIIVSEQV